jgi:hypothetical protein
MSGGRGVQLSHLTVCRGKPRDSEARLTSPSGVVVRKIDGRSFRRISPASSKSALFTDPTLWSVSVRRQQALIGLYSPGSNTTAVLDGNEGGAKKP